MIPKLLQLLLDHSPCVTCSRDIRSGLRYGNGKIVTLLEDDEFEHDVSISSHSFQSVPVRVQRITRIQSMAVLTPSNPGALPSTPHSILCSDWIDEGDDLYVFGNIGDSTGRSPIGFVYEEEQMVGGARLLRATQKSSELVSGVIGAPVLNWRSKRICGILMQFDLKTDPPSILVVPISALKKEITELSQYDEESELSSLNELYRFDFSDSDQWSENLNTQMKILDKLASLRVVGHGEHAEQTAFEYLKAYRLKNEPTPIQGETIMLKRHQLFIPSDKIQLSKESAHDLWTAELWAKIPGANPDDMLDLQWGKCYVDVRDGRSELLLDNRPSAWTGNTSFGGRTIKLISHDKSQNFSLTEAALVLMVRAFHQYFHGREQLRNFGGVLKDDNLSNFLKEFRSIKDQNPEILDSVIAQETIRKISFGKNREKIGIVNFDIQLFYLPADSSVPSSVIVKSATTATGDWNELLATCDRWIEEYPASLN